MRISDWSSDVCSSYLSAKCRKSGQKAGGFETAYGTIGLHRRQRVSRDGPALGGLTMFVDQHTSRLPYRHFIELITHSFTHLQQMAIRQFTDVGNRCDAQPVIALARSEEHTSEL